MKIRSLAFILISVTAAAVLIGGCATAKKTITEKDFFETWSGTWVNTDVPGNWVAPQKFITHSDGTLDFYSTATSSKSTTTYVFTLFERWSDADGNTWFKAQKSGEFGGSVMTIYEYGKINDSGDTYELIYHVGSQEIDDWEPENPLYNYVVYYRQ
jgi:hypothetical protein